MNDMFDRLDRSDLTVERLAPLEAVMPKDWPEVWREFATSHFITLISAPGSEAVPTASLAKLAMALALGLASDHGGTQPYIPVGALLASTSKARKVMELLDRQMSYRDVAQACGLTESWVRRIESDWRRMQFMSRQGSLPLD